MEVVWTVLVDTPKHSQLMVNNNNPNSNERHQLIGKVKFTDKSSSNNPLIKIVNTKWKTRSSIKLTDMLLMLLDKERLEFKVWSKSRLN